MAGLVHQISVVYKYELVVIGSAKRAYNYIATAKEHCNGFAGFRLNVAEWFSKPPNKKLVKL
jgi:hypothetical protein